MFRRQKKEMNLFFCIVFKNKENYGYPVDM